MKKPEDETIDETADDKKTAAQIADEAVMKARRRRRRMAWMALALFHHGRTP